MAQYCKTFGRYCTGCMRCQEAQPMFDCAACGGTIYAGEDYIKIGDDEFCILCAEQKTA